MNIFENYNSAKQKYGLDVVNSLVKLGLPPQFLLSACRFNKEYAIPLSRLVSMFKEWTKYVVKYNNIDVNRISYEQFFDIIAKEKNAHCVPNILITTEYGTLGQLNNAKDVQKIPCNNQWCIKSQKWFDKYTSKGYVFFVIYLSQEPSPFTYVIAAIFNGNVEYYDSNDHKQYEDLRPEGDISNSDHEIYQRKIPKEIISYIYNIAANQTENIENQNNKQNINCCKNMNNTKKRIRLTESQLHNLIKECVRKTLQEGKKKDPMLQWFADFDKASKFRETMDYIKKGGRNPLKKSKTNNIKEGRMLNEYEDYVGDIYDGEPLGEIKDGEVREFARKMFIHVANKITNLQRKYSDDYELYEDLHGIGELCMMAKCGL